MDDRAALTEYLGSIRAELSTGIAAEHAYRPALKNLIESVKAVTAVNDPKRSEFGAPDFIIRPRDAVSLTLGYGEAKDIDADLDKVEKSEQMLRYAGYPNLFLTNYLEFRFYRNGDRYRTISIGRLQPDRTVEPDPDQFEPLANELRAFLDSPPEKITSGTKLASLMGAKARRIRDNVAFFLKSPTDNQGTRELVRIYELIQEQLVRDLDEEKFADMYAQTLVYGLFAARYDDDSIDSFSRQEARDLLPPSNPFLRQFFDHIAGPQFDDRLAYIVDELCAVFAVSDVRKIVHEHLTQARLFEGGPDVKDPVIHFYEDFLKTYDPKQRTAMGAFYTPLPIVRFIVRHVDRRLKEDFGLVNGIADSSRHLPSEDNAFSGEHMVQILDPAAGTGTFLNEISTFIRSGFEGQEGLWPSYVRDDLIPRLNGFELMMAPYTIAHLKLGLTLAESGATDLGERLNIFLTNSLEPGIQADQGAFQFGLADAVTQESAQASDIKNVRPIMVVVGNPPYRAVSSNKGKAPNQLVSSYKFEPGGQAKLNEKKHWLTDDYVKFIALAESRIRRTGSGVVGFITNHAYLDNPTFRGMRWHLTQTFDAIYILDLHGNKHRKETAPDGGPDDNVFDIRQGVAIIIGVRSGRGKDDEPAKVFHADLWGRRKEKFAALDADEIEWSEIDLNQRMYYFKPSDDADRDEYEQGVSLKQLFRLQSTAVVTMGDGFVVSRNKEELLTRITELVQDRIDADGLRHKYGLGKNYPGWAYENRNDIDLDPQKLVPYEYRPFDRRWIYYDKKLVWRLRDRVMDHLLAGENVGLIMSRQAATDRWSHVQVTSSVPDNRVHYSNKGIPVFAPLYIYDEDGNRHSNLDYDSVQALTANVDREVDAQEVFDYCYGRLHDPAYRDRFDAYLRIEFPVVAIPADSEEFDYFANAGRDLRLAHLYVDLPGGTANFAVPGTDQLELLEHRDGAIWINDTQCFEDVSTEVWEYWIGGYQPAQRWSKDRLGSKLSSEEIRGYQKLLRALSATDQIVKKFAA